MTAIVNTPMLDVNEVLDALEVWIKQRPGLEFANYGQMAAYRAEMRSIAKDKKRAMEALAAVRYAAHDPALLADSFRAFSGRLQWVPKPAPHTSHLEYTTGQYWPTEYRKAAAAVLETYASELAQKQARENPRTFKFASMADVKAANRAIGNHWFDPSTMRFFNTRVVSPLLGGRYFITSERMDDNSPLRHSVRMAKPDGSIETIGAFHSYTREEAREVIRQLMKEAK